MTENIDLDKRSHFLLYQTEDGQSRIEVRLENQNVWLTQAQIADLFQTTKQNVSLHLKNIVEDGELVAEAVVKEYLTTATDGKQYRTLCYNLDAILSVGYRVKSRRGTQFRVWATQRLSEYLIKGFVLDDQRLKNPDFFGQDYFDELLERIRDIRSSEKRFYQKIRDIYKLAVDYDPEAKETLEFFRIVQNKLHFAISGKTAAELISERANALKPNMGLTSWKRTTVRRTDVTIAKNYLNAEELGQLNRIVEMYLSYAEDQALRKQQIFMREWRQKLDAFLQFNEREILNHSGKISKEVADALALEQFSLFNNSRLTHEAEAESLVDDTELIRISETLNKTKGQKSGTSNKRPTRKR